MPPPAPRGPCCPQPACATIRGGDAKLLILFFSGNGLGGKNWGRAAAAALPDKARQACVSTPYGQTGLVGLCQRGVAGYVATLVDAAGKHHAGQP